MIRRISTKRKTRNAGRDAGRNTGRNAGRNAGLADRYAHRGYHDKPAVPENSMAAFRRAVEYGLPVEFDVHRIADGSLVVFHDDDLERETGVKGQIEDYDFSNLRKLRLEGTDEKIPSFDEVLDLFEPTGIPLLIELKVARGNYKELARAVCDRLDDYKGSFVIESFDPRALMEVRKYRPEIIRGQLSQNYFKNTEGLPFYQIPMLTYMVLNKAIKPQFIAYRFRDRGDRVLRRLVDRKGLAEAAWTIRGANEYKAAVEAGCVPIFEKIKPEELKAIGAISSREED